MPPYSSAYPKGKRPVKQARGQKRKRGHDEVQDLETKVQDLDPENCKFQSFDDLPLSGFTRAGLKASKFTTLTDIQARAIPLALKGSDILGAAKTGSGKTLAFLVPVLENLYRKQCIGPDVGLGALILTPTRELAIQIFQVMRDIGGRGHLFSAGLVIGGKSLKEERDALARMNILVCTPGRILQHLSQAVFFNVDSLEMLVLDEADRILDMGFQKDVDAILEYLPKDRQTLLFSATQTKKISDLARLSLQCPKYISVHETSTTATPQGLQQNYVLTSLPEKLDTLWSFIQSAKKSKILVFLSSGKQVRFVYESFAKMQPGIPILHLHGRQKQTARLDVTSRFSATTPSCLFATDVAARGLDFPAVDWVVQVDCPEDADTYIHRVGRTARYQRDGRAVLFLDPSEESGMVERLVQKRVPIERINIRVKKQQSIKSQLQSMCFKDPQLKYLGQKAFISYVRSIYLQKDKEIFNLAKLALEEFADSLGLPGAPRIKLLNIEASKEKKNTPRQLQKILKPEDGNEEEGKLRTKYDRMFGRRNQDVLSEHYSKLIQDDPEVDSAENGNASASAGGEDQVTDDENGGFLSVKRRIPVSESPSTVEDQSTCNKVVHLPGVPQPLVIDSKRREKLLKSRKKLLKLKNKGTHLVFDDDGGAHPLYELDDEAAFKAEGKPEELREKFITSERERVGAQDAADKQAQRERLKAKKEKRKRAEKEARRARSSGPRAAIHLEGAGDDNEALANFIADAGEESLGLDEQVVEQHPTKRTRKWFQDQSNDERLTFGARTMDKKTRSKLTNVPQTLEDLEFLAEELLD